VFDETGKEWLCKHVEFHLPSRSEQEANSEDWNMVCEGKMLIDRNTSTIKIVDGTI
jgi:hypothetical protein